MKVLDGRQLSTSRFGRLPRKRVPFSYEFQAGWATEVARAFWRKEKSHTFYAKRRKFSSAIQLVAEALYHFGLSRFTSVIVFFSIILV